MDVQNTIPFPEVPELQYSTVRRRYPSLILDPNPLILDTNDAVLKNLLFCTTLGQSKEQNGNNHKQKAEESCHTVKVSSLYARGLLGRCW
jgi:hypothetical protein